MSKRKKGGTGAAIGAALVGFEQAIFRNVPPAEEMVHHARPDKPIPTGDGGHVVIGWPDELLPLDEKKGESPVG